ARRQGNHLKILTTHGTPPVGVEVDLAESLSWWLKAAEQGEVDSHYVLGLFYFHGLVVEQDYMKAYGFLSLSVLAGFEQALEPRLELGATLTQEEKDEAHNWMVEWVKDMGEK
ncbi:MAG: tetratricopeptide repeat protein, partial [Opitutales bacterium]